MFCISNLVLRGVKWLWNNYLEPLYITFPSIYTSLQCVQSSCLLRINSETGIKMGVWKTTVCRTVNLKYVLRFPIFTPAKNDLLLLAKTEIAFCKQAVPTASQPCVSNIYCKFKHLWYHNLCTRECCYFWDGSGRDNERNVRYYFRSDVNFVRLKGFAAVTLKFTIL